MVTLRRFTREQFIEEMVLRAATKADAVMRLDDMEGIARKALANPKARLFHPLARIPTYGGATVWRTPNHGQGHSS